MNEKGTINYAEQLKLYLVPIGWGLLTLISLIWLYSLVVAPFPSDDISINILVSNNQFQIGSPSTITVEALNNSSRDTRTQINIKFPRSFLNGFVVDYPDTCTLHQGMMGYFQKISCVGIIISPGELITFNLTITPYQEGNYGGNLTSSATFMKYAIVRCVSSANVPVNITVIPK